MMISQLSRPTLLTLLALSPLFLLSTAAPLHADSIPELKSKLRKSKDPIRRLELVREIGDLAELEGASISHAISALGAALLDEDVRVARSAVQLLRREALRERAADHLSKALVKQAARQKSLIRTQDKNFNTLVRLMGERDNASLEDLTEMMELFNQFFEALFVVYEKIDTSTELIGEISSSLAHYKDTKASSALKKAVRRVHAYSPVESIPVMQAVLQQRSRSNVSVVVDLLQKYDFKEDQKEAKEFFRVSTGRRQWTDWGARYHRALSEIARSVDSSFVAPKHGAKTPEFWKTWFKENREKLPTTPDPMPKPPSVEMEGSSDSSDEDEDEDDEDDNGR